MTNRIEDALRALEQKWADDIVRMDSSMSPASGIGASGVTGNPWDWPEDSSPEDGSHENYSRICAICEHQFIGHERRPMCKQCAIAALVEAAPSPPDSSPKRRFRHRKRGTTYEIVANAEDENNRIDLIVYRGEHDDKIWARPASQFFDGRFEALPASTTNSTPVDSSLVVGPADSSQGEPFAWFREWDGDISDLENYVVVFHKDETGDGHEWGALYTHPSSPQVAVAEFQDRVRDWTHSCFGADIANDKTERNHRFLEESLEQVQSLGCTQSEAHQLVDYVFNRPAGDPMQEAGGVMVTFAALCNANGISMREAGETELARVWTKLEAIRAKQAAKPKHSPLPQADDEPLFTASMYGTAAAADKAREEWLAAKVEPQK